MAEKNGNDPGFSIFVKHGFACWPWTSREACECAMSYCE